MKCDFPKERLISYLYQEMASEEKETFEAHLSHCPGCQKEVAQLAETSKMLRAWTDEKSAVKLVFVAETASAGRKKILTGLRWLKAPRRAVALAAGFAALLMLFSLWYIAPRFGRDRQGLETFTERELSPSPEIQHPGENSGRISEPAAAKDDIQWPAASTEHHREEGIVKSIDRMASFMDTVLQKQAGRPLAILGKPRGVYLDSGGVVFFMKGELTGKVHFREEILDHQEAIRKYRETLPTLEESPGWHSPASELRLEVQLLEAYENALIELVGDDRNPLPTLQPTESIVMAVDLDNNRQVQGFHGKGFVFKVKKEHLDDYRRGKIKLADFRKCIQIQSY